jgi:transcription elongation factor
MSDYINLLAELRACRKSIDFLKSKVIEQEKRIKLLEQIKLKKSDTNAKNELLQSF